MRTPSESPKPLAGKVALVTCSSKGIGYAVAEALARAGAELVICSRDSEIGSLANAQKTLFELSSKPVSAIKCDLSTANGCDELLSFLKEFQRTRTIGIFVYISPHPSSPGALVPIENAQLDTAMEACIKTPLRLCQSLLPVMARDCWGRVFLLSSCYALRPTSKFYLSSFLRPALSNLARLLAQEYAMAGVAANTLLLGYYDTPLTRGLPPDDVHIAAAARLQADNHLPSPSRLGSMIAELCGQGGSLINGAEVLLDCGYLAQTVFPHPAH